MQNVLIICCLLFGFYTDSDLEVALYDTVTLHIFRHISLNNVRYFKLFVKELYVNQWAEQPLEVDFYLRGTRLESLLGYPLN
jgi:hypothetical protein